MVHADRRLHGRPECPAACRPRTSAYRSPLSIQLVLRAVAALTLLTLLSVACEEQAVPQPGTRPKTDEYVGVYAGAAGEAKTTIAVEAEAFEAVVYTPAVERGAARAAATASDSSARHRSVGRCGGRAGDLPPCRSRTTAAWKVPSWPATRRVHHHRADQRGTRGRAAGGADEVSWRYRARGSRATSAVDRQLLGGCRLPDWTTVRKCGTDTRTGLRHILHVPGGRILAA